MMPMTNPETDLHRSKRRKGEGGGTTDSLASSTPADRGEKAAVSTTHVPLDQDPTLLHHLDGYRIVRRSHIPFTSGGFCDIFIGDHQIHGKVAMRRPRMTQKGYTLREMENFFNESEIWKKLHHPNILRFIGLIQSDGNIWAVSRFAENGALTSYLKDYPKTDRHAFVLQLASAIRYLHHEGVVHGDIKGSNILVSSVGTVLLCDFGLSKSSGAVTRSLLSGAASIRWCAPELLFEEAPKAYASDVYSFGVTVYEILSGNVPLHNILNEVQAMQAINKNIRPPREPPASESGDSYEPLWDLASESWDGDPSNRPTMEAICVRLGVSVQVTSSSVTTAEGTSFAGGMFRHSGGSTSAPVAEDTGRGFRQSAAGNAARYDGYHTLIQQSSVRRKEVTMSRSMGTSSRTELRTEEDGRKEQEDERLIIGLPRAHARYKDTSTKPSRPCHPGTRKTLLQSIRDWITYDSSTLFFWLCGEVGVGKTTVAHTIAMEQDRVNQLGASFFFNRDNDHRRHPALFATTLAFQLSRFDSSVHQTVASALRADPDIAHLGLKEQFLQLVVQSLDCLGGSSTRKVVMVIDGLDECSNPALLLDVLPLLAKDTRSRLRVLVTSRPHATIVTKFKSTRLCHLTSESQFRNISSNTLSNDVRAFLEWSLGEIASEYSLPSPWPSLEQVNKLVSMADGLFVLASVFDRYIRNPVEGNPSRQLERILSRKLVRGRSPTAELDSMYDLVLYDVTESLSEDDIVFARNLLQLAFLSSERISISEMADVLGCTPDDVQSVVRRMTSVIHLPSNEHEAITPFHASFGEYIQDPKRCSVKQFVMDRALSHAELAAKFLEKFVREAGGGITGIEYDYNSVPKKLKIADRELRYHLSLASNPAPIQLQRAKDKFPKDVILTWILISMWASTGPFAYMNETDLVQRVKDAKFAAARQINDVASRRNSMVKYILDKISLRSVRQPCPADGRDQAVPEGSCFAHDADLEIFRIRLRWESSNWPIGSGDPRSFARMLWNWSHLDHPNIVPLARINLDSLLNLSGQAMIYMPLTSHYLDLKPSWYPALPNIFQRNSEEAIQMALGVARALQYLLANGFYRRSMVVPGSHFRIEDLVLSKEGKMMVHPAFLVYKDSVDPYPTTTEKLSLAENGFAYWRPFQAGRPSQMVWDFGCVIYERGADILAQMMTGEPPLKRYHDLVMGGQLIDDEPIDGEAPLKAYCDLVRGVATPARWRHNQFNASHYWSTSKIKPNCILTAQDILRRRYQTVGHHLLDDIQISEDLKGVLRARWAVDEKKWLRIQDVIAHLTAILEGLRNQNLG